MTNPLADERPGPLQGIVVADLSRILAGPYCTMLLADMGATVVKIESPDGDDTRRFAPPVHEGVATYYQSANRNKRSLVLDLADDGDLAIARDVIAQADVVVENFKAGGLRRFGLDYATLAVDRPDLVYASITGFGTGAGAHLAGYDLMVQALSGFMDTTGAQHGEPFRGGFALFDVLTGLHTAVGILAALRHRERTGLGQLVETNLLSAALSSMVNQTQAYAAAGHVPRRMGNQHPSLYPYEPFPTADLPLVIAVGNDAQFERLCAVIGRDDLATDPRFAAPQLRNAHRDALRPEIAAALADRGAAEWFDLLTGVGVPSAPIQTIEDGIRFAERIGLEPVGLAGDALPIVRNPLTFSHTPVDYPLAPPSLDEGGSELRERLSAVTREKTP
ncbi:CaiB/BaiF CoA transferase family protein [Microbacterium sp. PF5]|uniref:CaiB/BaiF CoA transferase family protein n=1 Tax=Microbacterium sp. PF5 TaxID=2305435 RepID=UPI00109BE898|nr:CoA transferase [Microbacterium sp. PF5]